MSALSLATMAIVIGAVIATVVFAAGVIRGLRQTFFEYERAREADEGQDTGHFAEMGAVFAVIAAIVILYLFTIGPSWLYLGPILALVSAFGVGMCFLTE